MASVCCCVAGAGEGACIGVDALVALSESFLFRRLLALFIIYVVSGVDFLYTTMSNNELLKLKRIFVPRRDRDSNPGTQAQNGFRFQIEPFNLLIILYILILLVSRFKSLNHLLKNNDNLLIFLNRP